MASRKSERFRRLLAFITKKSARIALILGFVWKVIFPFVITPLLAVPGIFPFITYFLPHLLIALSLPVLGAPESIRESLRRIPEASLNLLLGSKIDLEGVERKFLPIRLEREKRILERQRGRLETELKKVLAITAKREWVIQQKNLGAGSGLQEIMLNLKAVESGNKGHSLPGFGGKMKKKGRRDPNRFTDSSNLPTTSTVVEPENEPDLEAGTGGFLQPHVKIAGSTTDLASKTNSSSMKQRSLRAFSFEPEPDAESGANEACESDDKGVNEAETQVEEQVLVPVQ